MNSESTLKRAIIYCRVSSSEQTHGYSLQNQEDECRRYALHNGYTVIGLFVNKRGESAKTTNRRALQDLLGYVLSHARDVDAVIIWKYDRLARNSSDFHQLLKTFDTLEIELLSVTEQGGKTPEGKLLTGLHGLLAEFENNVKSERTKAGMIKAVNDGRWVWRPPLGYSMTRDALGRGLLKPNEEAHFVREAFELMATADYRQSDICRRLRAKGCKVSPQRLNCILRAPVYKGLIAKPEWIDDPVRGLHEPLVAEDVFDRIQVLLDGKKMSGQTRNRSNPSFPLRGYVVCPRCGKPITGSFSTSRSGRKYAYYHCYVSGCGFGNVQNQKLHGQYVDLLKSVGPTESTLEAFEEVVRDVWKRRLQRRLKDERRIKNYIKELESKKRKARDLVLNGRFSHTDYAEVSVEVSRALTELTTELEELRVDVSGIDDCIDHCCEMLRRPDQLWLNAELAVRQRFQKFVFPDGITYFSGTFGTASTSIIFNVLRESSAKKSNLATLIVNNWNHVITDIRSVRKLSYCGANR